MKARWISAFGALTALLSFSAQVRAATISGTIRDSTTTGISSAEVRLWAVDPKDDTISLTVASASDGTYSFTSVPAGSYKVDARPPGGGAALTDRWYDAVAPNGNGYVGADADVLAVVAGTALAGIDITLEAAGGFDGTVDVSGVLTAGFQIRVEQASVPQIFHSDLSQADPHLGEFHMYDLPPALDYQLLIHDPIGKYDTLVDVGPYGVTANTNSPLAPASMATMPVDPSEPNNSNTSPLSAINGALFRLTPPQPFQSTGAIIAPRGGDIDWYCFTALAGDRYLLDVASNLTVGTAVQEDPWVDPMVSFWSVAAGGAATKLLENDDADTTTRASHLDTAPLTADGTYCAAVSTFGDTGWTGAGQSAGKYGITIQMGNRPPIAAATYNALPVPAFPTPIAINEGDSIQIDLSYSDPDNDPLAVSADFKDSLSQAVSPAALFTTGTGTGTFTWTASYTARRQSPYTVTFNVGDAEFDTQIQVLITVAGTNIPPTAPVLLGPVDGGVVKSYTPLLTFQESTDVNDDPLVYDLDLTYGDGGAQQGEVDGGVDGGPTSWTVATPIPEDSWVNWRARAFDGTVANGYSSWTDSWIFYVNVLNEPPTTPVLTKPVDGDLMVMVLRPALEVVNPISIDNDPITITFEIASDAAFTTIVMTSPAVPLNTQANATSWVPTADLNYGAVYYARASATGTPGGTSPYSNTNHFQIKPYQPPSDPVFLSTFATTCNGLVVTSASGLGSVEVGPSTSPEGAPVTIQLQVFDYAQDPMTATPLFDQKLPSMSPYVTFDTSMVAFVSGTRYRFRARAYDGTAYSSWKDCDGSFGTLGAGDGGSTGGTGKTGCSCSTGPDASAGILLGAMALVLFRRRRETAA